MELTLTKEPLKKQVYILSGLGADERVFQKLDLKDFDPIFIKWVEPCKSESLENYSTRIIQQIPTLNPTLIGLSFGGIVAVEIAKQIQTEKVILIASAKTKYEIPFYFRLAGQLKLNKILPTRVLKNSNFLTNWFFGTTSKFDSQLLKQILI